VQLRKPNPIEKDALVRQELDGAWSLFNAWCVSNQLSTGLVTSRPVFTEWYLSIKEGKPFEESPLMRGWRNEVSSSFSAMIDGEQSLLFSYQNGLSARSEKH
jgi:hypothetical protein